jgi:hypothetical protein
MRPVLGEEEVRARGEHHLTGPVRFRRRLLEQYTIQLYTIYFLYTSILYTIYFLPVRFRRRLLEHKKYIVYSIVQALYSEALAQLIAICFERGLQTRCMSRVYKLDPLTSSTVARR